MIVTDCTVITSSMWDLMVIHCDNRFIVGSGDDWLCYSFISIQP